MNVKDVHVTPFMSQCKKRAQTIIMHYLDDYSCLQCTFCLALERNREATIRNSDT